MTDNAADGHCLRVRGLCAGPVKPVQATKGPSKAVNLVSGLSALLELRQHRLGHREHHSGGRCVAATTDVMINARASTPRVFFIGITFLLLQLACCKFVFSYFIKCGKISQLERFCLQHVQMVNKTSSFTTKLITD